MRNDYASTAPPNKKHRKDILITQNGYFQRYKVCSTCSIVRPLRSTHCSECNNCVMRFDHHCPWIGNCTGLRNYPFFYFFLFMLNVLQVFMILFGIVHIGMGVVEYKKKVKGSETGGDVVSKGFCDVVVSIFIVLYSGISMIFSTALFIYHSKLVSGNITTKEEKKKLFENLYGNPFGKGSVLNNWKDVLFPIHGKLSVVDYVKKKQKENMQRKETPVAVLTELKA